MQALIRQLNHCYRELPALYEQDFATSGFEWIECDDADHSIYAWLRRARDGSCVICVCNFTPVLRQSFRLGVPQAGRYRVVLNTDAGRFGGSGMDETEWLQAEAHSSHGRAQSIALTLPPLATVWLQPEADHRSRS